MKKILSVFLAVVLVISSFSFSASALGKKYKFDDSRKAVISENYREFLSEIDGDPNRIPIIVSSDQHGSVKRNSEIFKYIDSIVDWSKISKIINLGDTVNLFFNPFELLSYRHATECLPKEKRIEIMGNHDGHILPFGSLTNIFFPTPGAEVAKSKNAFAVEDENFNVRYIAVDPMNLIWTYNSGKITTKQADFIVEQLSKTDSKDVIFLSHTYLFRDALIKRDGSAFTGSEYFIGSEKKHTEVKQSFVDMLLARKNKTAGVFIDSQGKRHPYDFSSCQGDFLMTLHGHHHTEGYETSNGITEFLFQSFRHDGGDDTEPDCFYFAYIDTFTKKFKCWKNIPGYSAWEISIA